MEVITQISYNGYRANYKVTSFNSISFNAELIDFSGDEEYNPPSRINFIKINGRAIANSDVMEVVKVLIKQLGPENSFELQQVH